MSLPPAQRFDITFAGALTQWQACIDQTNDPCAGVDNPPEAGWQQFWSTLNADPDTRQELPWSTDVRWFYRPTHPRR